MMSSGYRMFDLLTLILMINSGYRCLTIDASINFNP